MADLVLNKLDRRVYYLEVGERIATLRRERAWTQSDVAQMLGVSQPTMLAYEAGHRNLPLDRAVQLAKIFRVSLMQLLGVFPVPPLSDDGISPRMARHVEALEKLSASDQQHIIELTKSLAKRPGCSVQDP